MDLKSFKLDIDELINEFVEGGSTTLADMKRVWSSKKFSFIFEASPSTNQACFMQSLYAHSIGYMVSLESLSHKLGGLYCLYCLYETQPFKPPFKIYLSLGELKMLKELVVVAKGKNIKVVSALVKSMLERNMFLFGLVDINESSVEERVNELTNMQNARVQIACNRLFANTKIENFIHMDLGKELESNVLKKMSTDYAVAKEQAINVAGAMVDIQSIKHIAEKKVLVGDTIAKTVEDWSAQMELFYQQTGYVQCPDEPSQQPKENQNFEQHDGSQMFEQNLNFEEQVDDDFGIELEEKLLSEAYEPDNEDYVS